MNTTAVVLERPQDLKLMRLDLAQPGAADVVVDVEWSGISTGTEKLLWYGRMPSFPGLGYPLVPGYESVGRVVQAGPDATLPLGTRVFVPGARCFGEIRGLFGGAASRLVVPAEKVVAVPESLEERAVLLALAATAHHAVAGGNRQLPDLVVGHGVLGRLIARVTRMLGGDPVVWECDPQRAQASDGYRVSDAASDPRRDYPVICDVTGDAALLDQLISRLAPGGEIILAGFYAEPLSFAFPPAFMREARLRVAAEWRAPDLVAVRQAVETGRLSLDGLITHRAEASGAENAYRTAFGDSACLKMVLDWRGHA
ncbi:3-hydroxyethyl bacteriochlorophyllide a dehydrogenase [Dongia mobilis]|uniref:3-hydroxyethyl bacteriochlorophyllide a dehydrogenase n=1 Tax=Dongia mobilis TaxID=578943 RepID=A0A4R6WV29_9PROT|nr:chlorophyll synthesis pathway protein BchC [Dongia mobilis]TDQ82932.1 3-hydroxyethyl bacteriochlorophyllide a dehydrogenase [Dongia mobilis]